MKNRTLYFRKGEMHMQQKAGENYQIIIDRMLRNGWELIKIANI